MERRRLNIRANLTFIAKPRPFLRLRCRHLPGIGATSVPLFPGSQQRRPSSPNQRVPAGASTDNNGAARVRHAQTPSSTTTVWMRLALPRTIYGICESVVYVFIAPRVHLLFSKHGCSRRIERPCRSSYDGEITVDS